MIAGNMSASEHRIVTIGGLSLEVRAWEGAGTPVVLLHEGLGSVSMWREFPDRLAARTGLPVLAWSRQGYGLSDLLVRRRDPDYMHIEADRVEALLDALDIKRAHLFGHSDGGSIALIAASRFPARVASLILEAPHVYVEQLTIDGIAKAKMIFETTDLVGKLDRHHANPEHAFRMWNDIWLDPRFRGWNIEDRLPSIVAPLLLIQGQNDEYGTLDQLARIESKLAHVIRIELEDCGHSPHRDRPDAVLDAVDNFLRLEPA